MPTVGFLHSASADGFRGTPAVALELVESDHPSIHAPFGVDEGFRAFSPQP
jgi:hypothetical protein